MTRLRGNQAGYSLVEVLVSGMLLFFLVSIVVTVVGTSVSIDTGNDNRSQARSILRSDFERFYNYRNFNSLPADTVFSRTVLVNPLKGSSIFGNLSTSISTGVFNTNSGTGVQVRRITQTLVWTGVTGEVDSVQLTKDCTRVLP